ncbi:PAS domain S-box protein [Haloferula rosea]|uniref:histidine kinase n=1 Tax=Haloferula rosea TaxID=490093 RepID=A0A934VGK8_9BACT|nr:PAS domain S-box protein [Haloferula rosea]MBK1828166.1 PAS domain S-box protein [Haloferula rosea]
MSGQLDKQGRIERRLDRERRARSEAERLLEEKSAELYELNQELEKLLASQGRTLGSYREAMSRLADVLLSRSADHEANVRRLLDEGGRLLGAIGDLVLRESEELNTTRWITSWSSSEQIPEAARRRGAEAVVVDEWTDGGVPYVAIPLKFRIQPVGAVVMKLDPDHPLDELGRMVVELVGNGVAAELERSESKSEIRLKEQRYESLFHASVDSIVIIDFDGAIRDVSDSAVRMFGMTRDGMLRAGLRDLVERGSIRRSLAAFRQVREVGRCHFEADLLRSDGSVFPAEMVGNAFEIGGEKRVYAIARDLTQRRKNQAAVVERERKFRTVFEQSLDGIVLHDMKGVILDVNETLCKLLGYSRSDLTSKHLSQLHPESALDISREAMSEVAERGRHRFECEFSRSDGSRFVAEVWANAFELGGDRVVQGIVRDVTNQRRREREIREAMEAAELANESKSLFLATMSHEIRTPLNGILGFADLLEKSDMAEDQRNSVEMIRKSGDVLLGLISNILDFSRAESGRIVLSEETFDPTAFLRETVDLHRGVAEGKGLDLSVEVGSGVPGLVIGARGELRQVMMNLVGNAVKFTEEGVVVVSLDVRDDETLRFSVKDTGIGFPEGDEEKLFDAFFQVDLSSTRRHGGTGLGLAICRRLLEAMGGKIRAFREREGGARFVVDLPLQQARGESSRTEVEPADRPALDGRGMKVLVVEDHPVNSRLLKMMLEKLGFSVELAGNGREALEMLGESRHIDLILMDMRMPEMDGLEASQRIRAGEAGEAVVRTPIVAVTANALEADREACRKAGMDYYLSKPINSKELERVLLEVVPTDQPSGI